MSIRAIEGLVPTWYTPPSEADEKKPTRFKLRPLDGEQYGDVAEHMRLVDNTVRITSEGIRVCLKHALAGWENFSDSSGAIEFSPFNFRLIPYPVRADLVTKVMALSELSGDEEKN